MNFFIVAISVLTLAYIYVGLRTIVPAPIRARYKILAWLGLILLLCLPPAALLLRFFGYHAVYVTPISWAAYVTAGYMSLLLAAFLAADLFGIATGILKGVKKRVGGGKKTNPDDNPSNPARRIFLSNTFNLGVIGTAGLMSGYGFYEARRTPRRKRVEIPIKNLPASFDGFRIVQITDLHIGPTIKRSFVQSVVDEVLSLKPDLVAVTGDLVDGTVSHLKHDAAPLSGLEAPFGLYFVTGNHEYYSGAEPWVKEIRRLGFNVLLNEHVILDKNGEKLVLAGVTDFNGGMILHHHVSDPSLALKGAPEGTVRILLAHQPRSVFEASKQGVDLQISGHTHGGQYFPWNNFVKLQQPFISGLNKYRNTWVYTSRGTGYWGPPNRFGIPSEVTEIILRSA